MKRPAQRRVIERGDNGQRTEVGRPFGYKSSAVSDMPHCGGVVDELVCHLRTGRLKHRLSDDRQAFGWCQLVERGDPVVFGDQAIQI